MRNTKMFNIKKIASTSCINLMHITELFNKKTGT